MKFITWWNIGCIFVIVMLCLLRDYDDTDDVVNKKRSGLALYTDYSTGCQYVKGGFFGGTTPRLGVGGRQICVVQE